ncbi:MAG: DnaJ family molecular chaperone, partial [Sphingomicrobium sp.]
MGGDASAYAALGLEPGADGAAVDRAYRKLIKEHHPDREGGDGGRAAEINRAYRDIRGPRAKEALEFYDHPDEFPPRQGWIIAVAALFVGLVAGLILAGPMGWSIAPPNLPLVRGVAASAASVPDSMNQPLTLSVIDG